MNPTTLNSIALCILGLTFILHIFQTPTYLVFVDTPNGQIKICEWKKTGKCMEIDKSLGYLAREIEKIKNPITYLEAD